MYHQDITQALEEEQLDTTLISTAAARRIGKSVKRASRLMSHHKHHDREMPDVSARRLMSHDSYHDSEAGTRSVSIAATPSLPKPINNMVKNYISSAFFKVTMGLPGLAMLLPYPSAYGAWRRIIVTRKRTYTASMMKRLMGDIGDGVTQHAWSTVHELDDVLAKGPIANISTYCLYGECR